MAYNQGDLDRIQKYIELQENASKNVKNLSELYETIRELKRSSKFLDEEAEKLDKKKKKTEAELLKLEQEKSKYTQKQYETKKKTLELELRSNKDNLELAKQKSKEASILAKHLAENLNTWTATKAIIGSSLSMLGDMTKEIINQNSYLFEQQKGVKMTELQMGILSKQSRGFRDNIYKTSLHTNQLGVSAKGLAEMQATYSGEIGRTVELTETGLQAMAELAEGTILGQENAARFAASMDDFGYSVERSRDFLEDSLNLAHQMGLNAATSTEKIKEGLELANKYNFQNGVRGVTRMALMATKMQLSMDSVAGMAKDAFDPEGAIEMAASLSVLGGTWSQLGDPFQLMFKARNDMAGFTEDIVKAAAGSAQFNQETGEFEIASMELHRLREVAKATGIEIDELTRMARRSAKFSEIKANISGNFDEEVMDFIASKGKFNKDSGEFKVTLNGSEYFVDELHRFTNGQLSRLAKEQSTLKERAIQAKNFDEMYDNVINQFKSTLLPGFGRFTDALTEGLVSFQEFLKDEEVLEGIADFGKAVGEFLGGIGKFIAKNPLAAGILMVVGKPAMWIARGQMLGAGFNSVVNLGRGTGGVGSNASGGMKGFMNNAGKRFMGTSTGGGKLGKFGRVAGRGAGILSLAGLGVDGISNGMDDNLNPWEAIGKTLDQNKFTTIGAIAGSVIPGLGTAIGAGIGGAIDHFVVPALSEDGNRTWKDDWGRENQDFVSRPGQKPIPFSSADTLIGMKKGGGIANHLLKQERKGNGGKMDIEFTRPLKIEGSLELKSGGKSATINLDDPILIRELSRLVQERISTEMNGKQSQNPVS